MKKKPCRTCVQGVLQWTVWISTVFLWHNYLILLHGVNVLYVYTSLGSEQTVLTQQQQAIINQQAIILVCHISFPWITDIDAIVCIYLCWKYTI